MRMDSFILIAPTKRDSIRFVSSKGDQVKSKYLELNPNATHIKNVINIEKDTDDFSKS